MRSSTFIDHLNSINYLHQKCVFKKNLKCENQLPSVTVNVVCVCVCVCVVWWSNVVFARWESTMFAKNMRLTRKELLSIVCSKLGFENDTLEDRKKLVCTLHKNQMCVFKNQICVSKPKFSFLKSNLCFKFQIYL